MIQADGALATSVLESVLERARNAFRPWPGCRSPGRPVQTDTMCQSDTLARLSLLTLTPGYSEPPRTARRPTWPPGCLTTAARVPARAPARTSGTSQAPPSSRSRRGTRGPCSRPETGQPVPGTLISTARSAVPGFAPGCSSTRYRNADIPSRRRSPSELRMSRNPGRAPREQPAKSRSYYIHRNGSARRRATTWSARTTRRHRPPLTPGPSAPCTRASPLRRIPARRVAAASARSTSTRSSPRRAATRSGYSPACGGFLCPLGRVKDFERWTS